MNRAEVSGSTPKSPHKNRLGRLLTAMVTPFDARGEVDYQQARRLALALLNSGSDGVVVAGTTGESPTLSRDERMRLFAEVKSAVGGRGAVVAGTGNNDTRESTEFTREAEKIGVDACLLVVPYYNRPTQQGLFEHFEAIARSTKLPCIIYNVPSRTVTNLAADTMISLSRIDNIVGVKEASGNLGQIAEIIQGTKEDFLVYSGNDGDTYPILALGGYGIISVASHLVGIQIRDMIDKFLEGKFLEAAGLHRQLLPIVNALFVVSNPVPLKWALNYVGFPVGKPRLPLVEPDEKSAGIVKAALKNYKIDLPIPRSNSRS
jgi:4-hydroxy-tetrahydrodipicolinate synthase